MRMSIVCQLTGILQVLTSPIKLAMPFQCNAMDNYDIIVHIQRCAWKIEIHQSINNNTQAHSHGTDADGAIRGAPHTRAHSRSDKIKSSARGSEPTRRAELIALFKCNAPCSTSVNCCRVLVCLLGRTTAVYAGLHKYIVCTCSYEMHACSIRRTQKSSIYITVGREICILQTSLSIRYAYKLCATLARSTSRIAYNAEQYAFALAFADAVDAVTVGRIHS